MGEVGWKCKFSVSEKRDSSIFKWILLLRHLDSIYSILFRFYWIQFKKGCNSFILKCQCFQNTENHIS